MPGQLTINCRITRLCKYCGGEQDKGIGSLEKLINGTGMLQLMRAKKYLDVGKTHSQAFRVQNIEGGFLVQLFKRLTRLSTNR